MTTTDSDFPRMIYTGPLPRHLVARREMAEEIRLDPPRDRFRTFAAVAVAATAALVVGIGIGGLAEPLFRPLVYGVVSATAARTPARPLSAPRPGLTVALASPDQVPPPPVATADAPPAPAQPMRAALLVLEKPAAAAPDRNPKPAASGSVRRPPANQGADEIAWLLGREDAARRPSAELATAANDPPH
ncbi:MAG: hypothetical protein ACJ798_08835 [Phenylobacterium sp.]